jgi:hypothetical protein
VPALELFQNVIPDIHSRSCPVPFDRFLVQTLFSVHFFVVDERKLCTAINVIDAHRIEFGLEAGGVSFDMRAYGGTHHDRKVSAHFPVSPHPVQIGAIF